MLKQYYSIKARYKGCILFFRLGDFYEMFAEDAEKASRCLEITLTGRDAGGGKRVPMCGVPYHSAETYIAKLVNKGFKVAICEQVEDPSECKGVVKREVVRVVTAGTILDSEMLDEKSNNFLAALNTDGSRGALAYVDLSTGEFRATEFTGGETTSIRDELVRLDPAECLVKESLADSDEIDIMIPEPIRPRVSVYKDRAFIYESAYHRLAEHLGTDSLAGFGCEDKPCLIATAGALIAYLQETQKRSLGHINSLRVYQKSEYMILDGTTRRTLELTKTMRDHKRQGSLLWLLDETETAMGGRLLRQWLEQPLLDVEKINARLDAVQSLIEDPVLREELAQKMAGMYDMERLIGKAVYGSANARDMVSLRQSLEFLPDLQELLLTRAEAQQLRQLAHELDPLEDVCDLLKRGIVTDPAATITEGGIIRDEYSKELDELRTIRREGKEWISNLETSERERTGIKSLKVGFNKVFGYYIEVTKANLDLVPPDYERKQTLANSERFITPALKEREAQVLNADEKILDLEYQLFVNIRNEVGARARRVQQTAAVIARLDVLVSLARVALSHDYTRPVVDNSGEIHIEAGRHPVVEISLQGEQFVPNDTDINCTDNRFIILTGPNMAGKSTYLRQVALITLMAQMGSFVPARAARIGIVDRMFTRVGASDDLSTGQSTFMVEMNEVANILNNATDRSLLILDEVGRGTSTYDGISIAWAVSEYIHDFIRAKTLFATHYHELTELGDTLSGARNLNVAVEEEADRVVFLREIRDGGADQSYGIEVARLAGIPADVLASARNVLNRLEEDRRSPGKSRTPTSAQPPVQQIPLFTRTDPVIEELLEVDINNLTPLAALNLLNHLKSKAEENLMTSKDGTGG